MSAIKKSPRLVILLALSACASIPIGHAFPDNAQKIIRVGYDRKQDVLSKMGQPYRRSVDSLGHEVYVYVWADGDGHGEKCVVAFNGNDVVYLVDVAP